MFIKIRIERIIFILFIGATFFVATMGYPAGFRKSSENIKRLEKVEIKNYQGKDLSSIRDFRENSIKGPQNIDKNKYLLKVKGLVKHDLAMKYKDIIKLKNYEKVVTLNCVEGWSVTILWQGVLVKDILEKAGYDKNAKVVIFRAYDGYSTSFPLKWITDNNIILAYKMNGVVLPPERGFPFQLVAENKWGYKWIKWITEIEVSNNKDFRGYWEQRGYNQNGDVNGPMFENR